MSAAFPASEIMSPPYKIQKSVFPLVAPLVAPNFGLRPEGCAAFTTLLVLTGQLCP